MSLSVRATAAGLMGLLLSTTAPAADLDIDFGGRFQTDLRFRVAGPEAGNWYKPEPTQSIVFNQNLLNLRLRARFGKFTGVADVDFVMVGFPNEWIALNELQDRTVLHPFRFDVHSLYFEAKDLLFNGFDLRVGHQLIQFGVGDQFNPTNTVNPNDVQDPLLFGEQQGVFAVRTDFHISNGFSITGALIPIFTPALIPASGPLALSSVERLPFYEDSVRLGMAAERDLGEDFGYPTVINGVYAKVPSFDAKNMQFFVRAGGYIGMQDIGVSFYQGFSDVPVSTRTHSVQDVYAAPLCNPDDPTECIDGTLGNNVELIFPRVRVLGFNMAGEIPLGSIPGLGYRLEASVTFPNRVEHTVTTDDMVIAGFPQPAGEYDYGLGGDRPTVLGSTPYAKWVLGLDYSFGSHVYVNTQWVHGMFDDLGAGDFINEGYNTRDSGTDEGANTLTCALAPNKGEECVWEIQRARLGDYLVLGVDINFASNRGLLRLFTIWDFTGAQMTSWDAGQGARVTTKYSFFTKEGFSAVLYPSLSWKFGNGLTLEGGALLNLGKTYSKFGDPSAGGSLIWTRGKFAF